MHSTAARVARNVTWLVLAGAVAGAAFAPWAALRFLITSAGLSAALLTMRRSRNDKALLLDALLANRPGAGHWPAAARPSPTPAHPE